MEIDDSTNPVDDDQKKHQLALQKQKDRRKTFKDKGICPNCEKNPAADGRVCCVQCLEDKKLNLKFGTAKPYRQLYAEIFEDQLGLCAICKQPMTRPILDQSEKTKLIRGLLCVNCNAGLKQFKDDTSLLQAATAYISERDGNSSDSATRD